MTRVQILLEDKEVDALRGCSKVTGKSYSQLVREAIDNTYISDIGETEIRRMALEAKKGKGFKHFRNTDSFLRWLWAI